MIYLIRHTAVDVVPGVCYGRSDVSLRSTFPQEAEGVKNRMPKVFFDRVFTSPSMRCMKLANYCSYPDATRDARLMELDFGAWEGRRWDDLGRDVWRDDWIDTPPPGGESLRQMYTRVAAFLDELPPDKNILAFTHGGVIRCASVYFGENSLENAFEKPVDYGEIATFSDRS
jgi:alpha-ribazole phosphatase